MSVFFELNLLTAKRLEKFGIIPVLSPSGVEEALAAGRILRENGLPAVEITFRTAAAEAAIRALRREFPEMLIGAGTVLNESDLATAIAAGAEFAVAPGFNPAIAAAARMREFSFIPGVATPSELEQAAGCGCALLKFFPAEALGGVRMLKAVIPPYRHLGLRFMPTGGVTRENAAGYLALPEVAAVGGTWLVKTADFALEVRKAVQIAKEAKC